jgi:hypothetical protein
MAPDGARHISRMDYICAIFPPFECRVAIRTLPDERLSIVTKSVTKKP